MIRRGKGLSLNRSSQPQERNVDTHELYDTFSTKRNISSSTDPGFKSFCCFGPAHVAILGMC